MKKDNSSNILYKVYYSDGSTFKGNKSNVGRTPIWEVLLVVEKDLEHGKKIVSGGDYYVYEDGKWISCDFITMMQYMARDGMSKRVLVGVMSSHEKWSTTVSKARADTDFPNQTALHKYETKEGY